MIESEYSKLNNSAKFLLDELAEKSLQISEKLHWLLVQTALNATPGRLWWQFDADESNSRGQWNMGIVRRRRVELYRELGLTVLVALSLASRCGKLGQSRAIDAIS